jgi:hypothetical protein
MVKIDFSFDSQYGTFSDALWLEDDHGLTEDQISAMQQQRFDNWIAVITAPPSENVENNSPATGNPTPPLPAE